MEIVIPESEYGAEQGRSPPDFGTPGGGSDAQSPDSDGSELERAFGGGGDSEDAGKGEKKTDEGPSDLEKEFLK